MAQRDNQRHTHFIDPEVQGALTRRIVGQWVVFTAAATAIAFLLTWMSDPFSPLTTILSETWWRYAPLLLVLVCMLPIFVMDTVKLSNKFTGPVFRLRQVARKLAAGERPEPVNFRGGDFWRGLADDMNLVIQRVADAESASGLQESPSQPSSNN
ncbi:hypothetical protein Pla123a_19890 [Posidoniimonas polymericola]|uniref:HAMP domain-containing protein n=1 Tax=Posidoniimonas polymericola TaxID=2528002 RepID=A0A5C5YR36_9BACT|nr:hypothetical protein [Posidoniimonas polymericola]TWT77329.1 hypothetical protein Pla123a_19890 [Posidoniimonas polymericola]